MLRFHGILLPQRRTLEWKDNTSEASSFCSWGKKKTHALMHIPSHKQGFVCADEERFSSPHQSCCAPWSTCCMQSRSQQSNTVPLLCSDALLMCREPTAPADSRQVTDRDNSQVSGRHAVSHEHGHVWHSASITTGASLALIYTFTHHTCIYTTYVEKFLVEEMAHEVRVSWAAQAQTPWDIPDRHIFSTPPAKLCCSIKDVKMHPICWFRDCYSESICNLRQAGRKHWTDWF